jgi:hypothetical protein
VFDDVSLDQKWFRRHTLTCDDYGLVVQLLLTDMLLFQRLALNKEPLKKRP